MNGRDNVESPAVGEKAPNFAIQLPAGKATAHELAARHKRLVITTQDSYRYHRN